MYEGQLNNKYISKRDEVFFLNYRLLAICHRKSVSKPVDQNCDFWSESVTIYSATRHSRISKMQGFSSTAIYADYSSS
jgi:hypothetical protein